MGLTYASASPRAYPTFLDDLRALLAQYDDLTATIPYVQADRSLDLLLVGYAPPWSAFLR